MKLPAFTGQEKILPEFAFRCSIISNSVDDEVAER